MASGIEISALPAATALTGDELVPIVQEGVTRRTTLADWLVVNVPPTGSFWLEDDPPARFFRPTDRVLVGSALEYAGSRNKTNGATYIGDPSQDFNSFWLENTSALSSLSPTGGIGGFFATRRSDKYGTIGHSIPTWVTGQTIALGDERGYRGNIYVAASSGTTGATPPTHTGGTVSDGGVDWTHTGLGANGPPIGLAFAALNDAPGDAMGVWGMYGEVVRSAGAGICYLAELNVKNKGSDVVNQPYQVGPAGATLGIWIAGGGDATVGAAANPSTAALIIGRNSQPWNTGIVFQSTGITGTDGVGAGTGYAIKMAKGHTVAWYTPEALLGAQINCSVDNNANRVAMAFDDDIIIFQQGAGATIGRFEHAGGASASANYMRLLSGAAGTSPTLLAGGSDTNLDLRLLSKGTGVLSFGTHTVNADAPVTGYVSIKDAAGTVRKLAVIA